MPETSIVITARDNYSTAIKSMSRITKSFTDDQEKMQRKLDQLRENQHKLQDELKESAKRLKAFADAGDEVGKAAEQANFDNVQRNLALVTKGAKAAETQMQRTGEAFSRMSNRAGSGGGIKDAMQGIGIALGGQMFSQLIQPGVNAWVSSALGSDAGSTISSALSGAISGGALGSTFGPVGAAIGAGAGALVGAASGALQNWEKKDDYFKSYYNGIIDEQAQRREAAIQSGSSIAASREQKQMAFATLLGSDEEAADYMARVKAMAAKTNYSYDDITGYAKSLIKPFGADKSLDILTKLSDASAALSLSGSDTEVLIQGLSRMKMTGKTTQEYLNYFSERGIDVYGALSKWGDAATVTEKVRKGQINGGEAAEAILQYIETEFGGLSERFAGTYAGLVNNLEDAKSNVEEGYGIGYDEARKAGLQAEIDAYDGSLGAAMSELNEIEGSLAAHRENLQEQYTREALGAVLTGGKTTLFDADQTAQLEGMGRQYDELSKVYEKTGDKEIGLKLENLRDQAEALAKEAFDSSEWAKKELSAQEENTAAIRELTAAFDGWEAKYHAEQETTKGRGATVKFAQSGYGINGADYAFSESPGTSGATGRSMVNLTDSSNLDEIIAASGRSHAAGLSRVPYDGYAAILHEGERVLTAQQARERDSGGGVVVNVSGNQFTVRSDADIDAIARAIAEQIGLARQAGDL